MDQVTTSGDAATVTVRLFAAARAAAGQPVLAVDPGPLDSLVASLAAAHPPRLAQVLAVSTLVCDGVRLDPTDRSVVPAGAVIDVLPPFAGG